MSTQKIIRYNDIYANTFNVSNGGPINWQINSGLSKVRGVLIVSRLSGNGQAVDALKTNGILSQNHSPFTSAHNFLGCSYTQSNLLLGGIPIYQTNKLYDYENFLEEIKSYYSLNGDKEQGITSGLISQSDYESGIYAYQFYDLSRKNITDDSIPMTVQFQAQNNSNVGVVLHAFVFYEKSFILDVNTSQVVV